MVSVLDTLDKLKDKGIVLYFNELCNESLITRARNKLVHNFLQSPAEYLLFIDSDIVFNGDEVIKLLSHKKDIMCGLYPKKVIDWDVVKKAAIGGETNLHEYAAEYVVNFTEQPSFVDENSIVEIRHAGTGFMCIHRSVFEKLSDKVSSYREATLQTSNAPEAEARSLERYPFIKEFFALKITEGGLYLSEDYYFCDLWRSHGGKIYADLSIRLRHMGTHVFSGNLQHHIKRG